ncbi:MAG: Ig-like domain-containing protein, partial [Armatimonadetes bacterium]|nr:Ig-like domain-containing protein [Candidatus Hippobium faecium]
MLKKTNLLLVFLLTILCLGVMAAPYQGKAVILTQNNGASVNAFYCNDGEDSWYQDENGFAIVKVGDAYYYAQSNGTALVATEYLVGEKDPIFLDLAPFSGFDRSESALDFGTDWYELAEAARGIPQDLVAGEVTPIVILCNYIYVERSDRSKDVYIDVPGDIYSRFKNYWSSANNYLTKNIPMYSGEKATFRHSFANYLRFDNADYQYDFVYTLDQIRDRLALYIEGNEDIYDQNHDGYIDKILFVVAGKESRVAWGDGSYDMDTEPIAGLYPGKYTAISTNDFRDYLALSQALISNTGFASMQPVSEMETACLLFGKTGDKAVDEDTMNLINGGNNGEWNMAQQYMGMLTRDNVSLGALTGARDADWKLYCSDTSDILSIINDEKVVNFGASGSYDSNEDGFVDNIIVVFSSEVMNNAYVSDYSESRIKFRNTDLYIGKVIVVSSNNFTKDKLIPFYIPYTNYISLSRNNQYLPAYNMDALSGFGQYTFLPVNIYSQRQAAYLEKFGRTDAELGIGTINEDNCYDKNGKPVKFTLQPSINDPSKRIKIAYKIQSPVNEDEEFWVEYRVKSDMFENMTEPEAGLYVYRVVKSREGMGNIYAGQGVSEYVPDEVYYFRTDGEPDYGAYSGLDMLNGDTTKANIGVYGRKEISYNTNPRVFFSNGDTDCGFSIYNISTPGNETISFNVKYGINPPDVVSFTPSGVNCPAESDNFVDFTAVYKNDAGAVSLWKNDLKWIYEWELDDEVLNLSFDNAYKAVTMLNCRVLNERGKYDIKDLTYELGSVSEDGEDIIIENKFFRLNVTKSYWYFDDNKLYVVYSIAPTDFFVNDKECFDYKYFDSDRINVYLATKTFEGLNSTDSSGDRWTFKGTVGYTKDNADVIFESADPVNFKDKDYFIENAEFVGYYGKGAEKIYNQGIIYRHPASDNAVMINYLPELIAESEYTKSLALQGEEIIGTFKVSATGLMGSYLEGDEQKDISVAITDYDIEIISVTPEKIKGIDVREQFEKYLEEHRFEYLSSLVSKKYGECATFDWTDGFLGKEPMTIYNGLVTVPATSFSRIAKGNRQTINVGLEFDAVKTPVVFGEKKSNNIMLDVYGFASIEKTFAKAWSDVCKASTSDNTDYRYMGYYGLGFDQEVSKPVVKNVTISPVPTDNPYISSKILEFDQNIYYTVNYKLDKYPISDITFKLVDSSSKDQLFIKYNPVTEVFYAYRWVNDEWDKSEFKVEKNIQIGEFTIPCYSFTEPEQQKDGSWNFTFVARSKARFTDNPLTVEAQVTDQKGFESNVYVSDDTYIFRSSTGNIVPEIESITPCSGSIKTHEPADFAVNVSDQDGIGDIYQIGLILTRGGVDECYVLYDYQTNKASLLTNKGWSKAYKLGTNNEVSNTNFILDYANSYVKTVAGNLISLHLSIVPLSAFSGNSLTVKGVATDISISSDTENKYEVKKFGYITIDTDDPLAVKLNSSKLVLEESESFELWVSDSEGNKVPAVWSSDNSAVATVSNGWVNAVSAGSAKITAKVGDTALTCKVNVKEPEVEYT